MKNILIRSCVIIGLFIFLIMLSKCSYVMFKCIAETTSLVMTAVIFIITWNSRKTADNNYLSFLGIVFIFISIVDTLQFYCFSDFSIFETFPDDTHAQLWLIGRCFQAVCFLLAPLFFKVKFNIKLVFFCAFLLTGYFIFVILFTDIIPVCYISSLYFSGFRIISEYLIMGMLLVAYVFLNHYKNRFDPLICKQLGGAILLSIAAEMCFCFYVRMDDFIGVLGYFLKLMSFYLVYKCILEVGFIRPISVFYRDLKSRNMELETENARLLEELNRKIESEKNYISLIERLKSSKAR